uniref:Uncharacterized protein n=1 Tax=Caenorhabditis japonica TaxID=281687 RepID=A0A8R1HTR3_CAEJA
MTKQFDRLLRSVRLKGFSWKGSAWCSAEPVFGSTLSVICQNENSLVPKFIRVVTEVIESKGLKTDGIYRVSGNLSAVQKIRCQADQDNYKALVAEEDIHVLTGALKLFFRELSEPLFPVNLHKEYTSAMQVPNTTSRFKKFEELLSRLPQENRESLKLLLGHLNRVAAHSSQNRMQQHNLAIAFLCATKSSLDEKCTYEGFSNSSSYTENEQKENKSSAEIENKQRGEEEEEEFDDVCDDVEEEPQLPIPLRFPDDNNHSNDGFSNSDFEEDDEDVAPPARNVQIGRGPELPSFPRRLPSVKSIASCSTPFQQVNPEREYSLPCPESHEPVRTIRCGELERSEKIEPKSRKREWVTHYMYLTTAHLILYKDQKSAEKHGKHYDAPQGVWDLRGASVTWHLDEKDVKKKQRMYIQLELCNAKKYLLRGGTFAEITEWFEALKEIVAKLPAPDTSQHVVAAIDGTTKIVGRNLSYLGSTRPLSHALIPINRTMRRRDDPMSYSAIESRPTSAAVDESKPSKETILEKLRRFFRTRPTVESLKEKGIYKRM